MRFLRRTGSPGGGIRDDDPLTGVANLFDIGLVFIVGLLLALFGAYHLEDLLVEDSNITITRQLAEGDMEIIVKKGKKIEAMKVTKARAKGKGRRLGTAYRLADGSMVYVPEQDNTTQQREGK